MSRMGDRVPIVDEPQADYGRYGTGFELRDVDIENHRTGSIFTGVSPDQFRARRKKASNASGRQLALRQVASLDEPGASATPPQERVQFLLGGSEMKASAAASSVALDTAVDGSKEKHSPDEISAAITNLSNVHFGPSPHNPPSAKHDVFCEMAELANDSNGADCWKECARWVKFEEDVEAGGERWSKPHVAALSLHSLFELRCCIASPETVIMLDTDVQSLEQLGDMLVERYVAVMGQAALDMLARDRVRDVLLARKVHLFAMRRAHGKDFARSLAEIGHRLSASSRDMHADGAHRVNDAVVDASHAATTSPRKCGSSANIRGGEASQPALSTQGRTPAFTHAHSTVVMSRRYSTHGGSRDSLPDKEPPHSSGMGSRKTSFAGSMLGDDDAHPAVKFDTHFMKKIPLGAETANILVGEVDWLEKRVAAFVRLSRSRLFGDLTEVPLPTRYVFLLLAPRTPAGGASTHREIGRSIATLMSDEVFHEVAFRARSRDDLLAGIDEFLSNVTVLPPGEWDPAIRLEPPQSVPSQQPRKEGAVLVLQPQTQPGGDAGSDGDSAHPHELDDALSRTGRLFGGLIADVKRKLPYYRSDFVDAFHVQSLAAFVFLYFACLAPTITFGGMLNKYLDGYMATMESILSAALCGVVFALLSGQPMTFLGSTGPVLVFEKIIYTLAVAANFDYMSGRLWIGIWSTLMLVLIVAFDLSYLVRFITRFTEESFSCLVALIFVAESFKQLNEVRKEYPVVGDPLAMYSQYSDSPLQCACIEKFESSVFSNLTTYNETRMNELLANTSAYPDAQVYNIQFKLLRLAVPASLMPLVNATANFTSLNGTDSLLSALTIDQCVPDKQRVLFGQDCRDPDYVPDVFFFSVLLYFGTFFISSSLKELKSSRYFGARVRELISDFAVVIAIILMSLVDFLVGLDTPKLEVPDHIQPTRPDRGWLISPITDRTPVWVIFGSILPALLVTILVFMDQQITAVIVNRKENKLQKGVGYHLDLLVLAVLILACSFLGLPWFVATTVPSINHVMALRKESKCTAPGEQPTYLGCRENRLTGLAIAIMTALSVFLGFVLKHIPMPVLFGVFLFMGISCLKGVELVNRFLIMFMPSKNQPDYIFLRKVRLPRVHLFTVVQLVSLGAMWAIKEISVTSIAFPLLVLAMCFIRKLLDKVFKQDELRYLDDIIPEAHKRAQDDADKKRRSQSETAEVIGKGGHLDVPLDNGRIVSIPVDSVKYDKDANRFNFTEQVRRTSLWRSLFSESQLQIAANASAQNQRAHGVENGSLQKLNGEKKKLVASADEDSPQSLVRKRNIDNVARLSSNASAKPLLSKDPETGSLPRRTAKQNKEVDYEAELELPQIVVQISTPEMTPKSLRNQKF